MSVYLVPRHAYHDDMHSDGLPHPAFAITVSELRDRLGEVRDALEQGGAVLVFTDARDDIIGVLTREQPLLDEASIAAEIDSGNLPPIAELIAIDDRGETP